MPWLNVLLWGESRAWVAALLSGLFNLCDREKAPKEGLEGMKIRVMLGLLQLGKF